MTQFARYPLAAVLVATSLSAQAADLTVTMRKATADGTSDALGTVTVADSDGGATFKLDLRGLPPGPHGFHVHENPNCGPTIVNGARIQAGAASGHWDPDATRRHAGPEGDGHIGDLPALVVAADGTATQTLTAPRIKDSSLLKGHSLIIHVGGDNYSDAPLMLGGGGSRFACGIVE
jgi:Cu-Zn family superoxide dismutase